MRIFVSHPFALSVCLLTAIFFDSSGVLRCCLAATVLHETGHILAYKLLLKQTPVVRVHFGGLALQWSMLAARPATEASILLAGPLSNLLAARAFFLWAGHAPKLIFYYLSGVNLLMALFNLLPLGFLDGGRLLQLLVQRYLKTGVALYLCDLLQWISLAAISLFILAANTAPVTRIALLCFLGYFCVKSFCTKN